MLLTLPVKVPDGNTVSLPFIVRFNHSPANKSGTEYVGRNGKVKVKYKEHRQRTCTCQVYAVSPAPLNETSTEYETKTVGKCWLTLICTSQQKFSTAPGFTYIKAFGRQATFERCLRALITNSVSKSEPTTFTGAIGLLNYKFTNETFRAAVEQLRQRHPNGVAAADQARIQYAKAKSCKTCTCDKNSECSHCCCK